VFKALRWDVEADLAPFVGDAAAHRLHAAGQTVLSRIGTVFAALGHNAGEYVVEEAELMARGVDVARFNAEVDDLADAAARLEARLARLEP